MLYLLELLFALAPAYLWRFKIGSLPTNFLELAIFVFWLMFLIWLFQKNLLRDFLFDTLLQRRAVLILAWLFILSGLISVAISPDKSRAAGLFVAFIFQPAITYFAAAYILNKPENKKHFVRVILFLIEIFALYGIIQYFTLIGLPKEWWGNTNEPKRILSVFEYPNAFALYLAPLLAFCLPFVFKKKTADSGIDTEQTHLKTIIPDAVWTRIFFLIGVFGLLLTLSRGAWLGFVCAIIVFALLSNEKTIRKYLIAGLVIAALVIAAVPILRYRVILPFVGDKSTVSRYSLWHTANKMIAESPILGKGLYGYRSLFTEYNTDPNITPLNYPHNIFLNFWVEMGIVGLLIFLAITSFFLRRAWKNKKNPYNLGLILFLVTLYVHGLVDVPYFLNDLALVFWVVLALIEF